MSKRLSNTDFIERAILIHGNKYDYSKVDYLNNKSDVKIICPTHGEFDQTPSNHLNGKGCSKCANVKNRKLLTKTISDFIKEAKEIHGDRYDYSLSQYINNKERINIICKTHGEFLQYKKHHLNGHGCPKCSFDKNSNKQRKPKEKFISDANSIHDNIFDYSLVNYNNSHIKVKIVCSKHGVFEQTPSNHLAGKACPICSESKGENEIREFLVKNNINFITQYRFINCKNKRTLPFDFYLPDYNTCIEFNGRQHYLPIDYFGGYDELLNTQKRDKIKKEYCRNNNIPLIIIKYDEIILNKLFSFKTH